MKENIFVRKNKQNDKVRIKTKSNFLIKINSSFKEERYWRTYEMDYGIYDRDYEKYQAFQTISVSWLSRRWVT